MFVDPSGLSAFLAYCLDVLKKKPKIPPIGICETVGQTIAKDVVSITWHGVLEAFGTLQLCAGQLSELEVHVVCYIGLGPALMTISLLAYYW